jgi:hypothetical protein
MLQIRGERKDPARLCQKVACTVLEMGSPVHKTVLDVVRDHCHVTVGVLLYIHCINNNRMPKIMLNYRSNGRR